jgi:hypothetical protein
MKRAPALLVSLVVAVATLGATAQPAAAMAAHVWSNSDAFSVKCLGVTDTYPSRLYSLSVYQFNKLGYNPLNGALGAGFTRTAFLNNVLVDWGVYVHSHGDNYWASGGAPNIDSAFLQDPGSGNCNSASDKVRSSSIRTATRGSSYNVVIMSTCYLGSNSSTMPAAFQIAKTKSATDYEFYLGYVYSVYDSSSLRFEQAFWSYMNGGPPHLRYMAEAFTYATSLGGYEAVDSSNPFQANWWGNPFYDGYPKLPA